MNVNAFLRSAACARLLIAIAFVGALFLAFGLGTSVGFHKAQQAQRYSESYDRLFGPAPRVPGGMLFERGISGHGAAGRILSVSSSSIQLAGREGERSVRIDAETEILRFSESVPLDSLVPGDFVTVLGEPEEDGQVLARFVRVMPAPPTAAPDAR